MAPELKRPGLVTNLGTKLVRLEFNYQKINARYARRLTKSKPASGSRKRRFAVTGRKPTGEI